MVSRSSARLHALLRHGLPEHQARRLAVKAGHGTALYLLANRIPRLAATVLRHLPDAFAMRLLLRAIGAHAWTFAGSGRFAVISTRPWILAIANNPLARDEQADAPVCAWHATVFETLFRDLLGPAWRVTEIGRCAKGDEACQFMACIDPDQHARIPHPQTLAS